MNDKIYDGRERTLLIASDILQMFGKNRLTVREVNAVLGYVRQEFDEMINQCELSLTDDSEDSENAHSPLQSCDFANPSSPTDSKTVKFPKNPRKTRVSPPLCK